MKHKHPHVHEDGTPSEHSHFHRHSGEPAHGSAFTAAHEGKPHLHEHRVREVTIPVTFTIGSLDDIGLGGLKVSWLDAGDERGREFGLTAGAGVGSPYLEGSVRGPGPDAPAVYAQADIRLLARQLWGALREAQDDAAALAAAGTGEKKKEA